MREMYVLHSRLTGGQQDIKLKNKMSEMLVAKV